MKNFFLTLLCLIGFTAQAQQTIQSENGEKWWGAMTAMGGRMPLSEPTGLVRLSSQNSNNQSVPFLVSNYGRYIYSNHAFDFEWDGKSFIFTNTYDTIKVQKVGKTLRDAFVVASSRHFKPTGIMPEKEFFTHPQYNTWIELVYNQNQADIERYADGILSSGLPAGILMVDDNWQRYYGNFDFKAERFSDAKGMVDRLHQK
ncbi:MAG: glycoside hydrolase, partial [Mucinivorans sp.]